jgi:RHS repeat-associated protein
MDTALRTVTYTSAERVNTLAKSGNTATFKYNHAGQRTQMTVTGTTSYTRTYLGGNYEREVKGSTTTERLYLGGTPYSAPVVAVRTNNGAWALNYIHRDYLGSIVAVSNAAGNLVESRSYDAWGRLRNPSTLQPFAHNAQPALLLGRGYTGHEHLPEFGLINMNARLYDPVIGRFLSPDPYVQAPDYSQSFNRYAYVWNNPLIYTDPDGEFVATILSAIFCPWALPLAIYFDFFTDAGYQLQKYVSPVAVQVDFSWGTHEQKLGINVGVGVPKLAFPVAPWVEGGATYFWKGYGDYQGWEFRLGVEVTFFNYYTWGTTQYWAKSGGDNFSQRVGYLKFGIPGNYSLDIYNDMAEIGGDGGDRFRTSRVRFNWFKGALRVENTLFAEDPGLKGEDRAYHEPQRGPRGTYRIKNPYALNPEKYRHGILSIGIGPISIGYDSEEIRRDIQNFIHDLPLIKSPYFEYLPNKKRRGYFQFGSW